MDSLISIKDDEKLECHMILGRRGHVVYSYVPHPLICTRPLALIQLVSDYFPGAAKYIAS